MPSYKDMDVCLPVLKNKLSIERDQARRTALQIAINIITALPSQEIQEGVICRDCFFYAKDGKTCLHKNGIRGRVLPKMFCSYGSYGDNGTNNDPEEEFEEFADA